MLNTLQIFDGVKTTRDYSVVQDNTKQNWYNILTSNHTIVFSKDVNYYRLPDVIRIEARYETIRTCPYGCLILRDADGNDYDRYYFWIDNVKLLKQNAQTIRDAYDVIQSQNDVLELTIAEDVWANNYGNFTLYDSYVERRHMDRWKNTGTELSPVYEHIYYPNAGQGVDGAMKMERMEPTDLFKQVIYHEGQADEYRVNFATKCFMVTAIKPSGEQVSIICIDTEYAGYAESKTLYRTYNTCRYLNVQDLLDGTFFTATGLTAENVQSVVCLPEPPFSSLINDIELLDSSGTKYLHLNFSATSGNYYDDHYSGAYAWITLDGLRPPAGHLKTVTPTKPDVTYLPGDDPSGVYSHDEHEPMLYLSPARVRKITTGLGGTVIDIPDIRAFMDTVRWDPMYDMTTCVLVVFFNKSSQNLNVEMNVEGDYGIIECATLPIYNSAWRSYEAINKIGDEIAYNAKQLQTFANGAAGTATNAIVGGAVGGGLGAAANIITGIVGTGTAMYGNEEELRAKQVTIRNSPANVKSGGSGLAAYLANKIGPWYVTLKMDDQSFDKLRQMYYWFGYIVNRTFKGTIDLSTRKLFDFIKTNGAKIHGNLTAGAAQQISEIFDKGVSIYHGSSGYDKIGASDLYNNDEEWL